MPGAPESSGKRGIIVVTAVVALALFVRLFGHEWGIIHYRSDDVREGVRGTVYTFMPDEKEFLGCFRSLADSYKAYTGGAPQGVDARTITTIVTGFLTGQIHFAPVRPTTINPLMPFLVFLLSIPFVGVKYLLGFYPVLDTNVVFRDALVMGRFITIFFDLMIMYAANKIMTLVDAKPFARRAALFFLALLPSGVIGCHLITYNTMVTFFELMTVFYLMRYGKGGVAADYLKAAAVAGTALAAKSSAVTLYPVLFLVPLFSPSFRSNMRSTAAMIVKGFALSAGVYLAFILYCIVTVPGSVYESLLIPIAAFSKLKGPLRYTKLELIDNYLFNTLVTGMSWSLFLSAMAAIVRFFLSKSARRDRACWILFGYTFYWIAGTITSTFSILVRLMNVTVLLTILAALFIDRIRFAKGLTAVIAIELATCAVILGGFYSSDDIRVTSSAWIKETIPAGSTIGFQGGFPYWYSPVAIYTDFHWSKHRTYNYQANYLIAPSGDTTVDFVVTTRMEEDNALNLNGISRTEYESRLRAERLDLIKEFTPNLRLGPWQIRHEIPGMYLPNIFVSDIRIYGRSAPAAADTSAPTRR